MKKTRPAALRHSPGLDTRIVDDDVFVITPATIEHLNATAAIVWLLLEQPSSRRDLLATLKTIYPGLPWQKLSADLGRLLRMLVEKEMIVETTQQSR